MHKTRTQPSINPRTVHPVDQARGEAAEEQFRTWLDAGTLPHLYIDQTPMTVPAPMRGKLKRPDYLVGVPGVGLVAFDVKSKTLYGDTLIFDLEEIRKLRRFARYFHCTVFFACLDPAGSACSFWVRLDQLDHLPSERRNGALTVSIATIDALSVSMRRSFHAAFIDAVALS